MGISRIEVDARSPALLIEDIDRNRIAEARNDSVNYLRDRRPEIYRPLS
jgi:hypothetical protein